MIAIDATAMANPRGRWKMEIEVVFWRQADIPIVPLRSPSALFLW